MTRVCNYVPNRIKAFQLVVLNKKYSYHRLLLEEILYGDDQYWELVESLWVFAFSVERVFVFLFFSKKRSLRAGTVV